MFSSGHMILSAGVQILAPLTRGGNVPFRRLCADFGAEVTMSEMSFARMLLKGDVVEKARLRKADNEHCFGRPASTQNFCLSCWLHQGFLFHLPHLNCRGAVERHIAQYSDPCIQSQYPRGRLEWVLSADCTTPIRHDIQC